MKLRITKGSETGRLVEPDPSGFSIGRGQDNDLVLPGEGMSRHHCRLEKTPDGWVVEDLGSVNGVRVDGMRVEGRTVLTNGCVVDICGQQMEVEVEEAPARMVPPALTSGPAPADTEPPTPADGGAVPPILYQPEGGAEQSQLPWGRIALLAAMCVLIAALVYLLVTSRGGNPTEATDGETQQLATDTAEPGDDSGTPAVSLDDQDLDRLLKEEAALAANAPDTATGTPEPAPATTTDEPPATAAAPAVTTTPGTPPAAATDMVLVRSTPEGATVLVDDEEKGTTPALITGLSEGRHRITLRKDGYEEQQRLIHVPDLPSPSPYLLRQRPNTLYVTSDPPGVSIWRGSQWLGVAPVLLQGLPAGEATLTLALAGCKPQRQKVTISAVRGEQLQVEMKPPTGLLEITTLPAGCRVLVDGVLMGTTGKDDGDDDMTGVLSMPNILAGERAVRVEHPCGASLSGKLPVTASGTLKRTIQLWVPDTRVTLLDGTVSTGMLRERNAQGDLVLALTPRPKDMVRYFKPRIREEQALSEAEMADAFRKVVAPEPDVDVAEEGKKDDGEEAPGIADRWGDEAVPVGAGGEAPIGGKDAQPGNVVEVPLADFAQQLERYSKSKFLQRYKGKSIQLTGKATGVRRDGLSGVVHYGRRIICEMERDVFAAEQEKLNALKDTGAPITVRGHIQGFIGDRLILRGCQPVYGPAGDGE